MRFNLEVRCNNAAFEPAVHVELARIITECASRVAEFSEQGWLRDANGNVVGAYQLTREE